MFGNKKIFALDISDESIKFVEYFTDSDGVHIGKFGEKNIPAGIIEYGEITDVSAFREIIKSLQKEYKIKRVKVSLHLETDEVSNHTKEKIIEEYVSLFKHCDIDVFSIELHINPLAKAVMSRDNTIPHMILSLNDENIEIHFVQNSEVLVSQKFLFDKKQELNNLVDEIQRHFIYWHTDKTRPKIEKIVLVGSRADLSEFRDYISARLHHSVEFADVWQNILPSDTFNTRVPAISFEESLKYAPAIGLILE